MPEGGDSRGVVMSGYGGLDGGEQRLAVRFVLLFMRTIENAHGDRKNNRGKNLTYLYDTI